MNIPNLKQTAQARLSAATYDPKKLSALHVGVALAVSLLMTLVNFLLTRQMDTTAGLEGITTRAILSFAQALLMIAGTAAMPFWDFGFYRASLNLSRNEPATAGTLLSGFRRFGVVLRLLLLQAALFLGITVACLQAASILFMLSPWGEMTMVTAEQLLSSGGALDESAIEQMMQTMYPVYILFAVLVLVILFPILYRFRLAEWAVMDDTPKALRAMGLSSYWMHGNRRWLLRLDLSFWWYYGLLSLSSLLAYGDKLLPILGVSVNPDVAFFGSYLLSALVQLVVMWQFAPQVQTTYALAYDALRAQKPPIQTPQPKPSPWEVEN